MPLRNTWLLIVAVSTAQFVCLVVGFGYFTAWLRDEIEGMMRGHVAARNRAIAQQLADGFEHAHDSQNHDSADVSASWDALAPTIGIPREGGFGVVNLEDGAVEYSTARFTNPPQSGAVAALPDTGETVLAQVVTTIRKNLPQGITPSHRQSIRTPVGSFIVAMQPLEGHDAAVLVYQSEGVIRRQVRSVLLPIRMIGTSVMACIVLTAILINVTILRRYEDKVNSANKNLEATVRRRTQALVRTRNAIIYGLAKLAESRDNDTGSHLDRIREYVTILATELSKTHPEIDDEFINRLGLASSLHDIGKVGIPDHVLLKPGSLSKNERDIMQAHPEIGGSCLALIRGRLGGDRLMEMAWEIAKYHHEWWDGTGYPSGKAGNDIPLAARITAVADVYDALTTRRPYKEPLSHEQAYTIILEGQGTHFDPSVVEAFRATEALFENASGRWAEFEEQMPLPLLHTVDIPTQESRQLVGTVPGSSD